MNKVLVLGGTGFLGYYTTLELLKKGYEVKSVALPPMPDEALFAGLEVENILADINTLSDEAVRELLADVDAVMYAIGADERTIPKAPAYDFFYQANVLPTQRLARLARESGVKKFIVYGSYTAEFAERFNDIDLKSQPYPKTRLLQEAVAFEEGQGKMDVMVLRLPYIFGVMPGRMPLWKMFTDLIKNQKTYPALVGGTAMITVEQVAQAAVGAMEQGQHGQSYAIASYNMKYKDFYEMIVAALNQEDMTQIIPVTYAQVKDQYEAIDQQAKEAGVEHGIHMTVSGQMNERDLYIDPNDTMDLLKIENQDVLASIEKTLAVCVKG